MVRAALTGGIATGKSFCLGRLAALGAATVDADVIARDAVAPGTAGLAEIVSQFGDRMLRPDGSLDRPALADLVFRDAKARARLEAIVHPEVYRRITAWFANLAPGTRLAVADIPLLFETGHEHQFERVIVVACDADEQIRRLMARNGLSYAEARARIAAQWPIEEKARRADYVIRTDGTFAETEAQVRTTFRSLIADP
jgi:dephospho-CoA kinase